ncbi:MAG: hypothetical protein ACRDN6_05005 [Gaiellaceae bacterium]
MNIGDLVTYQGRPCYLRGIEPMSVPDRRAVLEDADTGQRFSAPLAEVEEDVPSGVDGDPLS